MLELASRKPVLKKRLKRLLGIGQGKRGSEIATTILPQLKEVGQLALIGGAVRDVARMGVARFQSDLDFVLYDGDLQAFHKLMRTLSAKPNRFGGYAIRYARWRVDIWALEDTWARTAGLRRVERIEDILNCTFFDWDAIFFDLKSHDIIAKKDYFQRLGQCVLDINLLENPNPTGSLVRALRRGALWQVRFGAKLTSFARQHLHQQPWEDLVALDASAFACPVLWRLDPKHIRDRLEREIQFDDAWVTEPFGPPKSQLRLPL